MNLRNTEHPNRAGLSLFVSSSASGVSNFSCALDQIQITKLQPPGWIKPGAQKSSSHQSIAYGGCGRSSRVHCGGFSPCSMPCTRAKAGPASVTRAHSGISSGSDMGHMPAAALMLDTPVLGGWLKEKD